MPAHGQQAAADSLAIGAGITQYILTIPRVGLGNHSPALFVIDTTQGGWNALVASGLTSVHTPLLLSLPDSQAYFALHLAVGRVDFRADTIVALISWNTCRQDQLGSRGYESGGEAKSIFLVRAGEGWQPAFPGATPARAVPAFVLIACGHAFAAAVAWRTATRTMRAEKPSRPLFLVPMVLLVVLFAYALEEPGGAYSWEGAPMHTASMFLFACAVSDLLVAALMVAATAVFPQQARAGQQALAVVEA